MPKKKKKKVIKQLSDSPYPDLESSWSDLSEQMDHTEPLIPKVVYAPLKIESPPSPKPKP